MAVTISSMTHDSDAIGAVRALGGSSGWQSRWKPQFDKISHEVEKGLSRATQLPRKPQRRLPPLCNFGATLRRPPVVFPSSSDSTTLVKSDPELSAGSLQEFKNPEEVSRRSDHSPPIRLRMRISGSED